LGGASASITLHQLDPQFVSQLYNISGLIRHLFFAHFERYRHSWLVAKGADKYRCTALCRELFLNDSLLGQKGSVMAAILPADIYVSIGPLQH
jgi:hypothetical protein